LVKQFPTPYDAATPFVILKLTSINLFLSLAGLNPLGEKSGILF